VAGRGEPRPYRGGENGATTARDEMRRISRG